MSCLQAHGFTSTLPALWHVGGQVAGACLVRPLPTEFDEMIVQEGREALRSALSSAETRDGTVARLLKG